MSKHSDSPSTVTDRPFRIATWHLVALGILLNILSALLTNGMIDEKNQQVAQLKQSEAIATQRIDELWQQIQESERKRELFLVLWADRAVLSDEMIGYLHKIIARFNLNDSAPADELKEIMALFDHYQQSLRDEIDTLWLDNSSRKEKLPELYQAISHLRSLALFLQLAGLILLVARDLSGRRGRNTAA